MKKNIFTIYFLSAIIMTVSAQNQFPSPRYGTATIRYNDTAVYIYGGVIQETSKSGNQQLTSELWHYNPSDCTFKKVVPSGDELPGMYACSPVYDPQTGKIYFLGGLRTAADNAFYSFDPQAFQVSKKTQQPYSQRSGMSGEYIGSGKFLFSGGRLANGTASSAAYVFNAAQLTITQIADIPQGTALYGHNTISDTVNNKAYIFGGLNGSGNNNFSCYEYNTQTNSWGFGPSIQNYPQNEWTAFPASGNIPNSNEIFIAGGQKYSTNKSTNSIFFSSNLYTVNVVNGNLTAQLITNNLPPMIGGSAWCSLDSNNDTIFYFFGGIISITTTGDTTITNNFYRYNQTTSQLQQYDTTQQTWGGIISSINETDFSQNINLQIYPNPATKEIKITIPNNEPIESINIYNQNGQLVKQITKPNKTNINVSDLNTGLYFIRTDSKAKRYLSKMIKE